jgi:hypothetical protein
VKAGLVVKRGLAVVALLALPGTSAGCGAHAKPGGTQPWVGATVQAPASRDRLLAATGEAVWRGDLAAAEVALTALADRERGRPDTALDFWSELLALLRCEPLGRVPRVEPRDPPLGDPWERLRRLVQIERVRLSRAQPEPPKAARMITRLDGQPVASRGAGDVVWPIEREHWNDEVAVPVLVTHCEAPGGPPVRAAFSPAGEEEMALVAATARALPAGHPAAAPLLLQAAVLEVAHGYPGAAIATLALFEQAAGGAAAHERGDAVFAGALAAVADREIAADVALARARAAFALDIPPVVRRSLALLLAERLDAGNRSADAAAILGAPPHGDDAIGRYIAFRQVQAHARAGRRAELLAEAREALHRHGRAEVDADPALGAVMDMALRTLEASPVSAETLEVLEALGPPRERLSRAEAFAQMADAAGAHASAMSTFAWLYDNDTDAERKLQHLAHECVAAARAGARAEFARTFQLLAGQEELEPAKATAKAASKVSSPAKPAKPTERSDDGGLIASAEAEGRHAKQRQSRSVDWQRALLVVARDALPSLVDNDDQADLGTLVATLKRHLDEAGRGPVDEELTTLYRAASAHLKSGPRAYAETVGSKRRPILLGDILIGRSYDVRAPAIDLAPALEEAGPLVFVPRSGTDPAPAALRRWPAGFRVAWTGGGS